MSIPASQQVPPLQAPGRNNQLVDSRGYPTTTGYAALYGMYQFINGCSRLIPCNASTTTNTITLTMLPTSPLVKQYADYDKYQFVADATSTGNLSALVATPQGNLATLNVYKSNGSTRAAAGDVTINLQYELTYADSLNGGSGGFVLR